MLYNLEVSVVCRMSKKLKYCIMFGGKMGVSLFKIVLMLVDF